MEFRTEIAIPKSSFDISHQDQIVTIGSCFSNAIGDKLSTCKFPTLVNPFGSVYNPMSIHDLLCMGSLNDTGFVSVGDQWFHLDHHSTFCAANKSDLNQILANRIASFNEHLKKATVLVITYGTSWVYRHIQTDCIVSNCHKLPAQLFQKELLSQNDIVDSFRRFYQEISMVNPTLKIVLTISPVRHLKDTISLNSLSKSILRVACDQLVRQYDIVSYFPSFEIVNDDLRDYRFFKTDMIHPNEMAEDYIFEKWSDTYFSENTRLLIKKWQKVISSLNHKPFNYSSLSYQDFLNKLKLDIIQFRDYFDVSSELEVLHSRNK